MKILCIGDTHFKDNLSYAEHISDQRVAEKKEILDFVVKQAEDCEHIVFLGDVFHSKNNSSETNRQVVEFLERFENKQVYIISGNHDKKGDGKTAVDFLGAIKKDNWHVFTKHSLVNIEGKKFDFLPYMLNSELGVTDNTAAIKYIMEYLDGGDILFTHHNISGTYLHTNMLVDTVSSIVLPQKELEERYKLIIAGDIHSPQQYGNVTITGSLFTAEVGEKEKFIWKIDEEMKVEKIKVPCRPIYKLIDPTDEQLSKVPDNAIIKVIVTVNGTDIESMKEKLKRFDASLLIEDYPSERKKMNIDENNAMDFSIENLLKMYSEVKNVDYQKLVRGLELLNE